MKFYITCPATGEALEEYEWGKDIAKVVNKHMTKHHSDWIRIHYLTYVKLGETVCPICDVVFTSARGVDSHVRIVHKEYVKIDYLEYEKVT